MTNEQLRWYPSKIDWWVVLVLCISPLVVLSVCILFVFIGSMNGLIIGGISALFLAGIYLGLIFPMRYGIDDTYLIVRFGICRYHILLADIIEVQATRNPVSSPALSLDRLQIQFGQGFRKAVMISPAERELFLNDLAHYAKLQRKGEQLFRLSRLSGPQTDT